MIYSCNRAKIDRQRKSINLPGLPRRKANNLPGLPRYSVSLPCLPRRTATGVYYIVAKAIREGVLIRPDHCSKCGRKGLIIAHHEDYSKPLDIEWLCRRCHIFKHQWYIPPRPK